jgi:hypothetical protein
MHFNRRINTFRSDLVFVHVLRVVFLPKTIGKRILYYLRAEL